MREKLTDKMLEEKLRNALNDSAPDLLNELMTELGISDETPLMMRDALTDVPDERFKEVPAAPKKEKMSFGKMLAVFAAAVVLMAAGTSLFGGGSRNAFAVVGIDVNPSVEISIDKNEKVIKAEAINPDGKEILDGMNLKGSDVKVACNALLGSMLAKGYLTDVSNSVLVTVRSEDPARGREIEKQLTDNLNTFLENSAIAGAIMGDCIVDDEELEEFAELHGISLGKAWLIRIISSSNPEKSPEMLAGLSTQELLLLAQQKKVRSETSYGSVDTSSYIDSRKAIEIALAGAGVSSSQASGIEAEFDAENGVIVYEVEFVAGNVRYEYNINAETGNVISYDTEQVPQGSDGYSSDDDRDDDGDHDDRDDEDDYDDGDHDDHDDDDDNDDDDNDDDDDDDD